MQAVVVKGLAVEKRMWVNVQLECGEPLKSTNNEPAAPLSPTGMDWRGGGVSKREREMDDKIADI